jgi:flagella basal body P-ring formation protein FlgA
MNRFTTTSASLTFMRIGQIMRFRSFNASFFCVSKKTLGYQSMASLFLSVFICTSAYAQQSIENIETLRNKVSQFLIQEYASRDASKVDIKVGNLDKRLRLAACMDLVFQLQDATNNGGNVNVQVSCNETSRWTILVPATASIFRPVAVASKNLQLGDVVSESDIQLATKDVSGLRMGYELIPERIIGKEIKYAVTKGDAFRTSALNAPLAIKRGDEVSVEAVAGSIKVLTKGTAISDGRIGQQIRVKNNQSSRIVNARVIEAGKVQSIL